MSIDEGRGGNSGNRSAPNGAAVASSSSSPSSALAPKPESVSLPAVSAPPGKDGLPPFPPGLTHQTLSMAFGMMQQPNMFAALSDPAKQTLIDYLDKTDERGFKHAQEHLQMDERVKVKQLEDRSKARRQVLILGGIITGAVIVVGAGLSVLLILKDKPEQAHTLMMAGFGVIGALLGGVGLTGMARKIWN